MPTNIAINRIMNKAKRIERGENFTLGFCRAGALPRTTYRKYADACIMRGDDVCSINSQLNGMLGDMTEEEYKNWLIINY